MEENNNAISIATLPPEARPSVIDEKLFPSLAGRVIEFRRSIFSFIETMWGLVPQPVKPEYAVKWDDLKRARGETWNTLRDEVTANWFGDYNELTEEWDWYVFEKGKHITWQQTLVLMGIEKAVANGASRHISVRSGHGIGKSALTSWIVLWFLWCYYNAQVPVTAPTSHQMHDVLWKELHIWIGRMKEDNASLMYEWQTDHIRVKTNPAEWFARARTSTKENTEAIAGVHGDHVLIAVDEASGVPEQVFNTAEGALTSGNVFVIMIGNPTRTTGYFFDSHHKNKFDWQTYHFDSEQSPMVNNEYVERQSKRHGRSSNEFKIRVKGEFPGEEMMDDSGYVQLIPDNKVMVVPSMGMDLDIFLGRKILGIDPSGEGKDKATFVLRDRFRTRLLGELVSTNPKEIAERALTYIDRFKLTGDDVVCDGFGVGATVGQEIAVSTRGKVNIYTVLVGSSPKDEEKWNSKFFKRMPDEQADENGTDLYLNLRALMFFRGYKWLTGGGRIMDDAVDNSPFKNELLAIKYKRTLHGNKIQLMSKKEMLKLRIPSPNIADAWALTFLLDQNDSDQSQEERERVEAEEKQIDDPFSVL
jgi:hypothetical protein